MTRLVLPLPGNEPFAARLVEELDAEPLPAEFRHFPDGESYVRLEEECGGREVVLVATLDHPDDKFLPLCFAARTARDMEAERIILVAPYLAYMRQDAVFREGEGVTAHYFADLMTSVIDGLVTVDPHLHRIEDLEDVYDVPCATVQSAPAIADWVSGRIERPVFVGPDSESKQWVAAVARLIDAPYLALQKTRRGDRDVEVSVPELEAHGDRTPVIIDDIISTARTMVETVRHLIDLGTEAPVCIGVHGIFTETALEELRAAGAANVVTTNTIPHETNGIDVSRLVAKALRDLRRAST